MVNTINKGIFWKALLITVIVFLAGLLAGITFENWRASNLDDTYSNLETNILDLTLQQRLLADKDISCNESISANIQFADRIYEEALRNEKYDSSTKVTNRVFNLHRKYDILRASLWKNFIDIQKLCDNKINVIIALYDYVDTPIDVQSKQTALGKVILDLKREYPEKIVLIPMASDTNVESINILRDRYNVTSQTAIIVNNKVITNVISKEELKSYLKL